MASKKAVETEFTASNENEPAKTKTKKREKKSSTRTKSTTKKSATTKKSSTAKKSGSKSAAKSSAKSTNSRGKILVIVESPSKAATLSGILGKNYVVKSSKGHIKDLPKSRLAIDIDNDFKPEYILVKGKAALKNELLKVAKDASSILLASDPDREGEAIAWHLADVLGVDISERCRVRFYEITANAIKNAVANPDFIDLNKVDAQQARRILDRLVGYKLSPLLWKKIRYGLSAGRVQSVALNLICEREREIQAFIPDPYWVITAKTKNSNRIYELRPDKLDGKTLLKNSLPLAINTPEKADEIMNEIRNNKIIVTEFKAKDTPHAAPAPFRTSTLQQEASRKLSMTPRRTMSIAQALYEGLNVPGKGHVGLITYMRTDSLRLSNEALDSCRKFIAANFETKYLPAKANIFGNAPKSKSSNVKVQDAHEAIRPTDVNLTPDEARKILTPEQYRLYDLIWRRFVASQMSPAITAKATLKAQAGRVSLRCDGESMIFDGWSKLWNLEVKSEQIAKINPDEILKLISLDKDQRFTRPPSRYSEAGLIKTLEENGVGRPSTYATIAATLDSRGYIEKNEEKRFFPTALGMTVDTFLAQYFNRKDLSSIVDAGFTAQMEKELDEVEEAQRKWLDVVGEFWQEFSTTLQEAEGASRVPLPEPEKIGEECPECGHDLVRKRGRFGEFIACSNYPNCKYTRPILTSIGVKCPKCGGEIVKRKSKTNRTFYGCSNYPKCDYTSWNRPTGETCPECGEELYMKGSNIFCAKCGYKTEALDLVSE